MLSGVFWFFYCCVFVIVPALPGLEKEGLKQSLDLEI